MYKVEITGKYKKDLKHIRDNRELVDEIDAIVSLLAADDTPFPQNTTTIP